MLHSPLQFPKRLIVNAILATFYGTCLQHGGRNLLTLMTTRVTCIPAHVFPKSEDWPAVLSTQLILTKSEKEHDLESGSTWASLGLSEHLWVFLSLSGPLWASLDLSGPRDPLFTQCSARVLGEQRVHLKRDRTQGGRGSPNALPGHWGTEGHDDL